MNFSTESKPGFNPEAYRGKQIHIVHVGSLQRVVNSLKPAEIETIYDAKQILNRITTLQKAKIDVLFIDDLGHFRPPLSGKPVIIGGAFDKQCVGDYEQSAKKLNYPVSIDPLLTLHLD